MAESLGQAVLDLTVDRSKLDRGMGQAEGRVRRGMRGMGGVIAKGTAAGAAAFAAVGAAAVGAAFKTASYGDEIAKTAPKLGISTDALQEARVWADRNGISAGKLDRAVGRLNQRVGRAVEGNEKYADAFAALGIELQDQQGNVRATEDVLADTISALSEIEDPALQSARAAEVFGTKMARDLMPALRDGSLSLEDAAALAHELGIVMDEDALAASERFTDEWANLKAAASGFLHEAGTPVMMFLAENLFPFIREQVVPALRTFGQWLGPKLKIAAQAATQFFNEQVVPAFNALSEWWQVNGPQIIAIAQQLWQGLVQAFDAIALAVQTVVGWFQSSESQAISSFGSIQSFAAETWPQIQGIIASAVDAIRAIITFVVGVIRFIWQRWGNDLIAFAARAWGGIQTIIGGALNVIQGIFEVFAGIFSGDWSRAWEGVKQIASGAWAILRGLWNNFLALLRLALQVGMDILRGLWSAAWGKVREIARNAWDRLRGFITGRLDALVGWFRRLPGRIGGALGNLGRTLLQKGKDLIRGLIDGAKERIKTIGSDLGKALGNAFEKAFSFIPGVGDGIGIAGTGAVQGWQRQWTAVQSAGIPGLSLMSGFRPGSRTRSGNLSYHARGRAVDVGGTPAAMAALSRWIAAAFGRNTKELIYSGAGGVNLHNGSPHVFSPGVRSDHFDHVHWAMDSGGTLQPGWSLVLNDLGRPEPLARTDDLAPKLDRLVEMFDERSRRPVILEADGIEFARVAERSQAKRDRAR